MSLKSTEENNGLELPNEIDVKWIDGIANSLDDIAVLQTDSYDQCFQLAMEIVRCRDLDFYTKAHVFLFMSLNRLKIGMGFDEKLFDECIELTKKIVNFDKKHIVIGQLVRVANRAKRFDLREKVYRMFRQKW